MHELCSERKNTISKINLEKQRRNDMFLPRCKLVRFRSVKTSSRGRSFKIFRHGLSGGEFFLSSISLSPSEQVSGVMLQHTKPQMCLFCKSLWVCGDARTNTVKFCSSLSDENVKCEYAQKGVVAQWAQLVSSICCSDLCTVLLNVRSDRSCD